MRPWGESSGGDLYMPKKLHEDTNCDMYKLYKVWAAVSQMLYAPINQVKSFESEVSTKHQTLLTLDNVSHL